MSRYLRDLSFLLPAVILIACAPTPRDIRRTALIPPTYGTLKNGRTVEQKNVSFQVGSNPLNISMETRSETREKVDAGTIVAKTLVDMEMRIGVTRLLDLGMKFDFDPGGPREKSARDVPYISVDGNITGFGPTLQLMPLNNGPFALGIVWELMWFSIPYTVYEIQENGSLTALDRGTEGFWTYNLAFIPSYKIKDIIFSGGISLQSGIRNKGYELQTTDTSSTLYTRSLPPIVFFTIDYTIKNFFLRGQLFVPFQTEDDLKFGPGFGVALGFTVGPPEEAPDLNVS